MQKVIAQCCTIPQRFHNLEKSIISLRNQVDEIRIFLNGFNAIPSRVYMVGARLYWSQDEWPAGERGKFHNAPENCYFLTFDDDMIYPPKFVETLKNKLQQFDNKIVAGFHGKTYTKLPINSFYKDFTNVYPVLKEVETDTWVNVIGTGCQMIHTSLYKPDPTQWPHAGMSDIYYSIELQKRNIPALVVAHKAGDVGYTLSPHAETIYKKYKRNHTIQTDLMNVYDRWEIHQPPPAT